jgi:hypothetical protein
MRQETIQVFQFDELSDSAKERARHWYRNVSRDDNFYSEFVYEHAAELADILGIDLRQTRKTKKDGSHTYEPTIYYSGFWSQGDGACYEGTYKYKKGALKAMRETVPNDAELIRIAKGLQDVQKRHFYKLEAKCAQRGFYNHSGCMTVDVSHSEDMYRDIGEAESDVAQLLRDFADWIYKQLEKAYEWENSDGQVIETIRANEYEFTENGDPY